MTDTTRTAASLGAVTTRLESALAALDRDQVVRRVWAHDYTLWSDDPTEITEPDRLGWLDVVDSMASETGDLQAFAREVAADGYTDAVLLGMGGSSLAPEVLQLTFGSRPGMLRLQVLDTTHPDSVREMTGSIELQKTLFIVASKSGSTIETLSHFDYFWGLMPDGSHYIAITDPGSPLQRVGEERDFRRVFLNRPDIGGRYSALSYFGLVPAALIGADLDGLLAAARETASRCKTETAERNPGAYLGAVMGEASLAGRDKLTLLLPDQLASFGNWVEQLLAESTGKDGKGILPVVGETPAGPASYGEDRLFVSIGDVRGLDALEAAGQPVLRLAAGGPMQLGAEFFRWEFATAIAGQRLRINPFDQPNVQSAKDATGRILASGEQEGRSDALEDVLASVKPGDYIALLAYMPRNEAVEDALQVLRAQLAVRYHAATTLGFGPRYLHSTGQLHKGGANNGVFLLLTDEATRDVDIPGRPYSFDTLRRAQALGDLQSLQDMGRRVAHVHLQGERIVALEGLRAGIS